MSRFIDSVVLSYQEKYKSPVNSVLKTLLHVGCGRAQIANLKGFTPNEWREIRLDIDSKVQPDIKGTLTDLSGVTSESVDVVYSSHSIEHIFSHEVPLALKEFKRVLKPDGFALIFCPDMLYICQVIAAGGLTETLYVSPMGPITPLDVMYGHGASIMAGNEYMTHKTGFTFKTLNTELQNAGFSGTCGGNIEPWNLAIAAFKTATEAEQMERLANPYF
tara:strand:- start:441 stop:1097 length:657 start_codon:yes stop_codon:yes gene_type:complete